MTDLTPETRQEIERRYGAAVLAAYDTATGTWTTADWTHELMDGAEGVAPDPDEEPEYCEGGNADCATCDDAASAALGAEWNALEALRLLAAGDGERATLYADVAESDESDFGDAPIWGPFATAVRAAVEGAPGRATAAALAELELELGDIGESWEPDGLPQDLGVALTRDDDGRWSVEALGDDAPDLDPDVWAPPNDAGAAEVLRAAQERIARRTNVDDVTRG